MGDRRAHPRRIGPYELLEELARGGAGVVHRARAPGGEEVALKVLVRAEPLVRARFAREARLLARLRHPNLIGLRDAGEAADGAPFIVLDLARGRSLEERIERGPLAPRAAATILLDVARGLEHAHGAGLVHRDLKPANVLLSPDGRARLGDFGLAKDLDPATTQLSQTGRFLGTPGYWPPEQARGDLDRIGARSDVYGLGAVLYACLSGVAPVRSDGPGGRAPRAPGAPRPPSELTDGVDPELEAICLRCLEAEPEDRYPSAGAFAAALEAFLRRPSGRVGRRRPSRLLLASTAAAFVVTILVLVGAVAALLRTPPPAPAASPERAETLARARAALAAGELTAAEAAAAAVLRDAPNEAAAHAVLGEALRQRELHARALVHLERAVELEPTAERLIHLGIAHGGVGRPAAACEAFTAALARDPPPAVAAAAHDRRGRARTELGELEAALTDLDRALELDPDRPEALVARARAHRQLGATARALADVERALALDPERGIAYHERGVLLGEAGDLDAALRDFDRSIELDPEHAMGYVNRARIWRARAAWEATIADCDRALAHDPHLASAWLVRADALCGRGDLAEAAADATRALDAEPGRWRAWAARGVLRLDLGEPVLAADDLERALDLLPPDGREARTIRPLLERARAAIAAR